MRWSPAVAATGIGVCVLAMLVTSVVYRFANRRYAAGKRRADTPVPFSHVLDWYLRLSTLGLAVLSLSVDHWALLQFPRGLFAFWSGVGLMTAAEVGFIWSIVSLGKQYSPCYDAHIPARVVRHGPYAWVRHPIYTANLLLIVGVALASGTGWLLLNLALLARGYVSSAYKEEAVLAEQLSDYRAYQKRTGMFLPQLFRRYR
jgi:protein-S-isoprenylcysteine O-methyltransferase Ste14